MASRLVSGEAVTLRRARVDDLAVGDVVAFLDAAGAVVAHRLVCIERSDGRTRLWTRGDGQGGLDAPWAPAALVGRVTRDGRLGRAIAHWPRLALPLGAVLRVRRIWDLPAAVVAVAFALTIQIVRFARRR